MSCRVPTCLENWELAPPSLCLLSSLLCLKERKLTDFGLVLCISIGLLGGLCLLVVLSFVIHILLL